MTNVIGEWIRSMAGAALVCGIALALTPAGRVKHVLKIISGAVMAIALISPLLGGKLELLPMDISKYRDEAAIVAGDAEKEQTNLNRTIIEQKLGSYILDKAQSLGIDDLSLSVVLKWGDEGFWYPYEISLITNAPPLEKKGLATYIEGELGIPESRQYFSTYSEEGGENES